MYSVRLFRWFIVLASLSIGGVLLTQIYWLNLAYNQKQKEFEQKVIISLNLVVRQVLKHNGTPGIPDNPVSRQTANYFEARVNDRIEPDVLKHFLTTQFQNTGIDYPFAFAVYDCQTNQLLFGGMQCEVLQQNLARPDFPKSVYHNNYFSVFFPGIQQNLFMELGTWLYFSFLVCVVLVFFIYSFFLITKQRQLAEMQKAFINNMAHELRTPLTAIFMSAEQLEKKEVATHQPYLSIIKNEANRLKFQLERVLSLNRKYVYESEEIEVNTWLQALVAQWQSNHAQSNIAFVFSLAEPSPIISGDKMHLDQAMANLFENTLKYAGRTDIEIVVSSKLVKGQCVLCIKDNGKGVLPAELKLLFKPFYRASGANESAKNGFGLGLSYVAQVMKAHKGKVQARLPKEGGFLVEIVLPLAHE